MRVTGLAMVLLLCAGIAFAQERADSRASREGNGYSANGRTWASRPHDSRRVAGATTAETTRAGGAMADDVCLSLHTLVVARDANDSDSTHLVSQRTCTPAQQFQMKSAVVKLNAK